MLIADDLLIIGGGERFVALDLAASREGEPSETLPPGDEPSGALGSATGSVIVAWAGERR
jgi:hypothetical protein